MKILTVDDEKLALTRLKRLLQELGEEDVTAAQDPMEALEICKKQKFDVAFLDISMPGFSGLELAQAILDIEPKTYIVFQTAFDEYALDAFEVGGIGYILKPFEKETLATTLQKIKSLGIQHMPNKKLLGKLGERVYLIDLEDIYYAKASLDEIIVRVKEDSVYVKKKIGDLELLLDTEKFFRIHRSIIVNVDRIRSMQTIEQSKLQIKFEGIDDIVTSSKDGAKAFREYLERRSL